MGRGDSSEIVSDVMDRVLADPVRAVTRALPHTGRSRRPAALATAREEGLGARRLPSVTVSDRRERDP